MTDNYSKLDFWKYFTANQAKFLFVNEVDESERDKMMDELMSELHKYSPNLYFLIGNNQENSDQELIITADGDQDYFQQVIELVEAAPALKDWKFTAFKPAIGFEFIIEFEEIQFNPSESWFIPLASPTHPDEIGLRICYNEYDPEREQDFLSGTLILLDNALGEKQMAEEIQYVEVGQLPEEPSEEGFIPLTELPSFLYWVKSKGSEKLG